MDIEMPGVGLTIVQQILSVATFDIPGVRVGSLLGTKLFPLHPSYLKEGEEPELPLPSPMDDHLGTIDIGSVHLSENTGSLLVFLLLTALTLVLIPILSLLRPLCHKRIQQSYDNIKHTVMWNFTLRLVLEASLDLSYSVLINLKYGYFEDQPFGAQANYLWSVFLVALYVAFPFFLVIFYVYRFKDLHNEDFVATYGATLEGLHSLDKHVVIYPLTFVLRRLIFGVIAVQLYTFIVG